jgi:hypothetical protein
VVVAVVMVVDVFTTVVVGLWVIVVVVNVVVTVVTGNSQKSPW